MPLTASLAIGMLVTMVLVLVLRPWAELVGLIDEPGERKFHRFPVPVVGGLAMFAGVLTATLVSNELDHIVVVLISASALMVLVGAIDDRLELNPLLRMSAHLVAALMLVFGTGYVVHDLGNLLGFGEIRLGWISAVFTIVACVALVNAYNMLDGLDGLAAGTATITFFGLSILGLSAEMPRLSMLALAMTGATLGFLTFNFPTEWNRPLRTFMGDAGSTLIGFLLAGVALVAVQPDRADVPPVIVLWLMPIPIFELFTSTARRAVKGLSPMEADTGHFHHRLLKAGLSVRFIFFLYVFLSALSAAIGISAYYAGVPEPVLFLGFVLQYAGCLLLVRNAPRLAAELPLGLRRDTHDLLH